MTENLPSPEQRVEYVDELRAEAAKCFELVTERRTPKTSDSLRHILGNLATILHPSYFDELVTRDPKMQIVVAENIAYIKRYFALMDEFSDFREKEEGAGAGYFPDLLEKNYGSRELIDKYEASLRGPASVTEKSG